MRAVRLGVLIVAGTMAAAGGLAHVHGVHAAGPDGDQEMGGHMSMTALRPVQPGDQQRADAVVTAARKFAEGYTDYRKALADGYTIFEPDFPQPVYHFTLDSSAYEALRHFDPGRPTSLLYERVAGVRPGAAGAYKLVGVMYTDRLRAPEAELNERVPLSIAQWHLHTNLCMPAAGEVLDRTEKHPQFGLTGSITTKQACDAAGGTFRPTVFGWMVHVYPFEKDPAKVWSAGMEDEHGMGHDAGMKM